MAGFGGDEVTALTARPITAVPITARPITARRIGEGDAPNSLLLSVPLQSSLIPSFSAGSGAPTFSRASTATVMDFEGIVKNVLPGEARFQGARRIENIAGVYADWLANGGATKADNGDGTYTFGALTGLATTVSIGTTLLAASTARLSARMRVTVRGVGTDIGKAIDIGLKRASGGSSGEKTFVYTLTSEWVTITTDTWVGGTSNTGILANVRGATTNSAASVQVKNVQIELVHGQSVKAPSEFVSVGVLSSPFHGANVDRVKYSEYKNGNTVSSGIVTEATGARIAGVYTGMIFGDSLADEPHDYCGRLGYFTHATVNLTNHAIAGAGIALIRTTFDAYFNASDGQDFVVIEGGINNITASSTDPNTAIRADVAHMVDTVIASGKTCVLIGLAPWKGDTQGRWTATKQGWTDAYNAWAASTYPDQYVDVYTPAEDPTLADTLRVTAPSYDSGDGMHINAVGHLALDNMIATKHFKGRFYWCDDKGPFGSVRELASTNLVLHSRDFTNAAWSATDITPTRSTGASGDSSSGSTLTATGINGTIRQVVTSAVSTRTISCDIKRKTGTGAIEVTLDGGATYTDITGRINSASFLRVQVTQAAVTNPSVGFRIATSGDSIEVDYFGLENATFASSRIETTTAAVSRSADVLLFPRTDNLIDAAGTAYCEASTFWAGVGYTRVISTDDNGRILYTDESTQIKSKDGTNTASSGSVATNDLFEHPRSIAATWGAQLAAYLSGATTTVAAYDGSMGAGTSIGIGNNNASVSQVNGCIRNVKIYSDEKSPGQVAAL